jgi:hypothetical protein
MLLHALHEEQRAVPREDIFSTLRFRAANCDWMAGAGLHAIASARATSHAVKAGALHVLSMKANQRGCVLLNF